MTDPQTVDPWRLLIDALPDGAVLTDATVPDGSVLYANRAFERLTGYAAADLLGRPLPVFDHPDGEPGGHARLRNGSPAGAGMRSIVRAVHRDGSPLLLDVHSAPVRDAQGRITHWASVYRRTEIRSMADAGEAAGGTARRAGQRDALTGLLSRDGFEARLREPAVPAPGRGGPALAVFCVDVDDLAGYNDTFGRAAGDAMLKRVAAALGAAFRRSSDVLARWDGGTFAAVAHGMQGEAVQQHAEALRVRVRDLCIHHPRSRFGRFVSVTVTVVPAGGGAELAQSLQAALASLEEAKAAQPAPGALRFTLP